MRHAMLLTFVLTLPCTTSAGEWGWNGARNPDLAYARYRARLDEPARNAEMEAQRQSVNASYLRLYYMRPLAPVPSRMIDPNLPVPRVR